MERLVAAGALPHFSPQASSSRSFIQCARMQTGTTATTHSDMKFSKARHGTITYRMAVINELGLLCLAWSLAAFNVMSVWNSGNRLQGLILGICWFAVGVMELSIIPLAGSLRIARWWDKPLALLGVVSLMGLTAFTVYEFNEFASYYLTKPGRDAVIQLSNLRQQAENLRLNTDQATKRQATGVSELNRLATDEQAQLSALEKDF